MGRERDQISSDKKSEQLQYKQKQILKENQKGKRERGKKIRPRKHLQGTQPGLSFLPDTLPVLTFLTFTTSL